MSSKVYVGNLGAEPLAESDIEEEFEEFGEINSIFVARNPPGFAYVDFDDERDAKGKKLFFTIDFKYRLYDRLYFNPILNLNFLIRKSRLYF